MRRLIRERGPQSIVPLLLCAVVASGCGSHDDPSADPPPDARVVVPPDADPPIDDDPNSCPVDYPTFCDASGDLPAACWSDGTDCSTRVRCSDGKQHACGSGYKYDCASGTCKSSTTPPPPAIPDWLVGTYSRTGKQENNVYFDSDNRSLTFRANGTYSHSLGRAAATEGTYTIASNVITFQTGALTGTRLGLSTNFDSTCRIILAGPFGTALWRHGEVTGCPTGARVTVADCSDVGTYTKKQHSGDIGPSGSGSESDYTWTVKLNRDRFYTYDQSSFKTTCFQFDCKYLAGNIQTIVGGWSQAQGAPPYSMAELRTWTFQRSTLACP